MKTTKLTTVVILAIAMSAMALPSLQVQISEPQIGDYSAEVISGPIGIYETGESFQTFCLERAESTEDGAIYDVHLSTTSYNGGVLPAGTGDPLDIKTAFLYSEFLKGNLGSVGYTGDYDSKWALQNVIWHIEDEGSVIGLDTGLGADLLAYAENADPSENYGVAVMVMTDLQGNNAQDMLVKVIPSPGAVVLGSIGVAFVGWIRRRKASV